MGTAKLLHRLCLVVTLITIHAKIDRGKFQIIPSQDFNLLILFTSPALVINVIHLCLSARHQFQW